MEKPVLIILLQCFALYVSSLTVYAEARVNCAKPSRTSGAVCIATSINRNQLNGNQLHATPVAIVAKNSVRSSYGIQKEDRKKQLDPSYRIENPVKTPACGMPEAGLIIVRPGNKKIVDPCSDKVVYLNSDMALHIQPLTADRSRPTVALVLGGGGVRGGAHIKVLQVLEREHIPIDLIVGNSAGAFVGGLYAAGVPLSEIERIMEDRSVIKAYMPGMLLRKLVTSAMKRKIDGNHYAGVWSGKKFSNFVDKLLPRADMLVSQTKIPFLPVACNLLDGQTYAINDGRLATAITASCALTPLKEPVAMGDKLFIDGGIRTNLPCSIARKIGSGIVIAVIVDNPVCPMEPQRFRSLKAVTERLADVVLASGDEEQLRFADVAIYPDVTDIPILSKQVGLAEKAASAGAAAADKAIPVIRNLLAHPPQRNKVANSPCQIIQAKDLQM